MNKVCSKCKVTKSLDCYYRDISHKDGKTSMCKSCCNVRHENYYIENKQQIHKNQRKYQKENKLQIANRCRKYYVDNKQQIAEYSKKYYDDNKQKILNQQAGYHKTEKGRLTQTKGQHNRRIKEGKILNTLTLKEKNLILSLQNNCCACCGKNFSIIKSTLDHIVPVGKGGPLVKENVQYLCQSCNSVKNINIIDYRFDLHKYVMAGMV